ncbi:MAG: D-glycerate dehydrogenase [Gemmatimonadota bacterium]
MSRPVVVVTRRLPDTVERELQARFDARLNREDRAFSESDLADALMEADGLLCTVTDPVSSEVLGVRPLRARILANFGVGYNHIDLKAAHQRGLVVTNTPGVLTEATADLAMALLLMVARRLGEGEREVRAGAWNGWRPTHLMGADVSGRTLGIVGLGRIGQAVARRAHRGFGMRVVSYTPHPVDNATAAASGITQLDALGSLLSQSDYVSLHCRATPETRHLINAAALDRMKCSAFLINTARGDIVDEAALIVALDAGRIAGAALDVYDREPLVPAGLLHRQNVVLLPHLGSATESTRVAMGMRAVENLTAFFETGRPIDIL